MKILFLDIDGVLVTQRYATAINAKGLFTEFDPVNVKLINRICELTDCKIVVHSSWRKTSFPTKGMKLIPYLIENGIESKYFHPDEPIAPMRFSSHKAHDINEWLHDHPETTQFIVLDDDNIFSGWPEMKDNQIFTTWDDGISYTNFCEAIELLGDKKPI